MVEMKLVCSVCQLNKAIFVFTSRTICKRGRGDVIKPGPPLKNAPTGMSVGDNSPLNKIPRGQIAKYSLDYGSKMKSWCPGIHRRPSIHNRQSNGFLNLHQMNSPIRSRNKPSVLAQQKQKCPLKLNRKAKSGQTELSDVRSTTSSSCQVFRPLLQDV